MSRKNARRCDFRHVVLISLFVLVFTLILTAVAMISKLPEQKGLQAPERKPPAVKKSSLSEAPKPLQAETQPPTTAATPTPVAIVNEVFFDESCRQLELQQAMSSPVLRFGVQRFFGTTLAVEAMTEKEAATPSGSRKRTVERTQYVPDDVITVSSSRADALSSFSESGDITFDYENHATATCTHNGLVVRYGEAAHTVTMEYRLLGKIEDPRRPMDQAPLRDKLGHVGREHTFSDGAALMTVHFAEPVDFYGLANRGANVKVGETEEVRAKNLDVNHYQLDPQISLYGFVPFVYAVSRTTHAACGFFLLNGSPMRVTTRGDFGDYTIKFETSDGGAKYFFFSGPTPADVLRQYFAITGRPFLPPLFSLGFHQSRWSYRDEADLLTVSKRFKDEKIPCDVLWLDIDHTNDKRYFTWEPHLFPDPPSMLRKLEQDGRRLVTITDPHIKRDDNYYVFEEAHKHGYFIADETGAEEFRGHCWPGDSSWIDFVNPVARKWYSSLFAFDKYKGSTRRLFSWIDMNEPSVFSGPDMTMPMEARHVNNIPHLQVHNLYGFYHAMATAEGHWFRNGRTERSFVLTRSFFAGSQRYAAVWTGDNQARWEHLKGSIDMVLLCSLNGITFVGADVGGFFGNPEPELLIRWFQLGSVYPFFRQHSDDHSDRREPFVLPPQPRGFIEEAIQFRYTILPYLYTAFAQTSGVVGTDGTSVARHLMLMFPEDVEAYKVTHTFMVGDHLLVRPIVDNSNGRIYQDTRVTFDLFVPGRSPKGQKLDRRPGVLPTPLMWYSLCTGFSVARAVAGSVEEGYAGSNGIINVMEEYRCSLPAFQRGGSIVPTRVSVGHSTDDASTHPIELRIALDTGDYAEGILYSDDGFSFDFRKGHQCITKFVFENNQVCAFAPMCALYSPPDHIGSIRVVNESALDWTHATVRGLKPLDDDDVKPSHDTEAVVDSNTHPVARQAAAAFLGTSGFVLPLGRVPAARKSADKLPSGAEWCVKFERRKKKRAEQ